MNYLTLFCLHIFKCFLFLLWIRNNTENFEITNLNINFPKSAFAIFMGRQFFTSPVHLSFLIQYSNNCFILATKST